MNRAVYTGEPHIQSILDIFQSVAAENDPVWSCKSIGILIPFVLRKEDLVIAIVMDSSRQAFVYRNEFVKIAEQPILIFAVCVENIRQKAPIEDSFRKLAARYPLTLSWNRKPLLSYSFMKMLCQSFTPPYVRGYTAFNIEIV